MPSIKNIIIFTSIAAFLVLVYIFFVKSSPEEDNLVSSTPNVTLPSIEGSGLEGEIPNGTTLITKDFLTLLLNVKDIKLDDTIFSDIAFAGLRDSSITLIPDGTEGRPNPFAKFGNDDVPTPPKTGSSTSSSTTNTEEIEDALGELDALDAINTLDTGEALEDLQTSTNNP
jgi:hypothetical protein